MSCVTAAGFRVPSEPGERSQKLFKRARLQFQLAQAPCYDMRVETVGKVCLLEKFSARCFLPVFSLQIVFFVLQ